MDNTCRREIREPIAWIAQCQVGDEVWIGKVRDLTNTGAFFEPRRRSRDGLRLSAEGSSDIASAGDRVVLEIAQDIAPDVVFSFVGEVRWGGFSDSHACGGFGLKFESGPTLMWDVAA